jgi:hypothetical protein
MNVRTLIIAMIGATAACMVLIGVVLIVAVFIVTRRNQPQTATLPIWQDPAKVDKLKIDPPLSIATLGGTNDVTAINAMLNRGELDSAYVTAIYATALTDRQRVAELLLVGGQYAAAEKTAPARTTFQAVMDIAALSPSMSDFERTEALAQAASSLYLAKAPDMAMAALDAGRDIALQSPFLKDANRFTLLGKLLSAAQQGNDSVRIKQLNEDKSNFVNASDANPATVAELPDPLPAIEAPPKDDKLALAQSKVISAAVPIAKLAAKGASVADDQVAKLTDALFGVDDQFVRVAGAPRTQTTLTQKIALKRAQIDWLTTKLRVARKGYGLSLVGEWEDNEGDISSELGQAYDDLNALRTEQTVGLPKQADIDQAQSNLERRILLAGRLGQYPSFPEADLVDQLNASTDNLINRQPGRALRVKIESTNGHFYYHLLNDDSWYGVAVTPTPEAKSTQSSGPTRRPSPTVDSGGSTPAATKQATPQGSVTQSPANASTAAPIVTNVPAAASNTPRPAPTNTAQPPQPTDTPVPPPPAATTRPYP